MNRARLLCEYLPVGELAWYQLLYCGIDAWLADIYCHTYGEESSSACGQQDLEEEEFKIQLEDWLHFSLSKLISGFDRAASTLLPGNKKNGADNHKDSNAKPIVSDKPNTVTSPSKNAGGREDATLKERDKLNAPRPYHLLFLLLVVLIIRALLAWLGRGRVIHLLNLARERIVATDTVDVGASGTVFPLVGKRSRRYDPLDVRQTEALILDILEANRRIPWFLPRPDIIFVFDELDKINPVKSEVEQKTDVRRGRSLSESVRQRKVEVEELLSNLKKSDHRRPL